LSQGSRTLGYNTFPGYHSTVEFSPDGRWLAYNSTNGTITLWDVVTRQPILEIKETGGGPVFSPDGKTLAAASIVLYSLPDGDILQRFESSPVTARAFSPDGTYLAAGLWPESRDDDAPIIIWDIASGQPIHELQGHRDDILSLDFSPNGELLASASYGQAFLWDVETGQKLKILDHYSVTSVDFSPDGTLLATGSSDGTVIIWPVE